MRDLEIRGAGNLLGDEQSGHVAALGFELYLAMLDEAVRGMDGTLGDDEPEPVRLDVNVDAYVPADYVPYEQAKVDVHRRVAAARDVADLVAAARRARGPLRPGARAAGEPHRPAAGAHQVRPGRRARGLLPRRAARRHAARARPPTRRRSCANAYPRRRYEPGRSQVSFRVPRDAEARFRIVVAAADALLAVTAPVGDLTAA